MLLFTSRLTLIVANFCSCSCCACYATALSNPLQATTDQPCEELLVWHRRNFGRAQGNGFGKIITKYGLGKGVLSVVHTPRPKEGTCS